MENEQDVSQDETDGVNITADDLYAAQLGFDVLAGHIRGAIADFLNTLDAERNRAIDTECACLDPDSAERLCEMPGPSYDPDRAVHGR